MKKITIDYSVSPVAISDRILGNQGEALATELEITLPDKMINDGSIAEFCGAFGSCNGVFHSKRVTKSEIANGVLLIPITAEISSNLTVSFQIEAFSSDDSLIMKTSLIEGLTFNKSVCRNHSDLSKLIDPADLANITAEIKANTSARHTHDNAETLDKLGETNGNLTYKGREVGSGGSGGKDEIYIGSGDMPGGYVLQIDPEGTADTIPTKTSQLVNDSGFTTASDLPTKTSQLINDSGFITVKDLPNPELPSVTEADNGKVLRVVNGVWAADKILIEQDTSGWELITEVALDTETAKYILCSCDEYDKVEIIIRRDSNNTSLTGNMLFEIVDSNGNSVVELYANNAPGYREKLTIMEVNSGYAHCIAMTANNLYSEKASLSRGCYVGNGCKYCLRIPNPNTACDGLSTMTVIGRRR